jgi:hypothetical protein
MTSKVWYNNINNSTMGVDKVTGLVCVRINCTFWFDRKNRKCPSAKDMDIKEVCGDPMHLWQHVYAYEVLAMATF